MFKVHQYGKWSTIDLINLFNFSPLIIFKQKRSSDHTRSLDLIMDHKHMIFLSFYPLLHSISSSSSSIFMVHQTQNLSKLINFIFSSFFLSFFILFCHCKKENTTTFIFIIYPPSSLIKFYHWTHSFQVKRTINE